MPFLRNSVLPLSGYILAHLTVLVNRKFAKNDGFLTKILLGDHNNRFLSITPVDMYCAGAGKMV